MALASAIRRLPIGDLSAGAQSGLTVGVHVSELSEDDALLWDDEVQRTYIDQNYFLAPPSSTVASGVDPASIRADVGWRWHGLWRRADALAAAKFVAGIANLHPCRGLVILLPDPTGKVEYFPIGMLLVITRFHCKVAGRPRERTFTWYLADAPEEVYVSRLRIARVKGVAKALMDCALQAGFDAGGDGEMLLHADEGGGEKLVHFYGTKCQMRRLSKRARPVSPIRGFLRHETDRYFHFDDPAGRVFSSNFNALR